MFIDPFFSESNFRDYLQRLKEFGELDYLIRIYLNDVIKHLQYENPIKGKEKGKDFVMIENEITSEYCSYIIKIGNLNKNLEGRNGILNTLEEALFLSLEEEKFKSCKRSAVVVYSGTEGSRIALEKYEKVRLELESKLGSDLLLRSVERWDGVYLAKKLFPHCQLFIDREIFVNRLKRMDEIEIVIEDLKDRISGLDLSPEMICFNLK